MKALFFVFLITSLSCVYCQNVEDPYKAHTTDDFFWVDDNINDFNGEYMIFTDKLFWNSESNINFNGSAISFSIEVVSFPFIPEGGLTGVAGNNTRPLNTALTESNPTYIESKDGDDNVLYSGLGWMHNGYKIYKKLDNIHDCDENLDVASKCNGDYSLASGAFFENFVAGLSGEGQCILPHTILKHTLYFHCGNSISNPIIDSLYWIYDNTRGAMKSYPFDEADSESSDLINIPLDVAFRPTFNNYFINWIFYYIPYYPGWSSNKDVYYVSGIVPNNGSINYFPAEQVIANLTPCNDFQLYYDPNNPSIPTGSFISVHEDELFTSTYVHPAPFALLDAPLLNYDVTRYAGYYSNGLPIEGIEQEYKINNSFDLRVINPSEKIIYNPSEVTISCNLTFPCFYQFLTLHGKYPDMKELYDSDDFSPEDWGEVLGFDFEYDKDYPIPVNCSTNTECISRYILDGCTLTIEPYVIIMDAEFVGIPGKANYIYYNPNYTYGNWSYDPNTVTLVEHYNDTPHCIIDNIDSDKENVEVIESSIDENEDFLSVSNSGKTNPIIKISDDCTIGTELIIYDIYNNVMHEQKMHTGNQEFRCDNLKRGVFIVVLKKNNEIIERITFSKM